MENLFLPNLQMVGLECGAFRWPNFGNHPDCWGRPWKGVVLSVNDPRAWEGTIAFGPGLPTQEAVDAHILAVQKRFAKDLHYQATTPFCHTMPVQWEFGKILWDSTRLIRPYSLDVEDWECRRTQRWSQKRQLVLAN